MVPSLRNGLPPFIVNLLDSIQEAIGPVYLVGGAVRNILQGRSLSNDLNVLTPNSLGKTLELLKGKGFDSASGGEGEKSIFLPLKGWEKPKTIEISKFRHRPAQTPTVEEDLLHRDITVNAMAYAWPDGPLIDPFNGRGDLDLGRIRLVNGQETLDGDPLRAIRLFRFSLQLSAIPDPLDMDRTMGMSLNLVQPERIRVELDRIFSLPLHSHNAKKLISTLLDSNLGLEMLPELAPLRHLIDPKSDRGETVWNRTIRTLISLCESPREEDLSLLDLRWATLFAGLILHAKDIRNLTDSPDKSGLQEKSLVQCSECLNRFGFSKRRQRRILHILNHLDVGFSSNDRVLKRLLAENIPVDGLFCLLFHWHAPGDETPSAETKNISGEYAKILERCRVLRRATQRLNSQDLNLSGGEILDMVRREPGPWMGTLQNLLLDWISKDPSANQPEALKKKVKEWIANQDKI